MLKNCTFVAGWLPLSGSILSYYWRSSWLHTATSLACHHCTFNDDHVDEDDHDDGDDHAAAADDGDDDDDYANDGDDKND